MPQPRSKNARALPTWLVVAGSAFILFHLCAVVCLALGASSGPWPTPFGPSTAEGPEFANSLGSFTTRNYLTPLKMTHNYHFQTDRPAPPGVYFEVRLKDDKGDPIEALRFPDVDANFWVRHRQALLAQALAEDQPVPPPQGETIPGPGQKVLTVDLWLTSEQWKKIQRMMPPAPDDKARALDTPETSSDGPMTRRIRTVPVHLAPREEPVSKPSEWSVLLARSYMRYLCRERGAARAELIRHTREPVMPAMMFMKDPPPGTYDELICNFGELSR